MANQQEEKIKELERSIKKMQKENDEIFGEKPKKSGNELLQFFIGLVLVGAGFFWIFQSTSVSTSLFNLTLGSFMLPQGTIIIPLLIGLMMLFLMDKKIFGWIVTVIGIAVILIAIIMSVRIHFERTSLFNYIMMFGMTVVGSALVLKTLLKKRN